MLNLELAVAAGRGRMSLPGLPVPSVQATDWDRQPAVDYQEADIVLAAWIRRAVHSEQFAKALEHDLETIRSKQ